MQNIVKALDTLSDDELRALITEAQALLRTRTRKTPLSEDPHHRYVGSSGRHERQRGMGTPRG
jgi:hypothetical protein